MLLKSQGIRNQKPKNDASQKISGILSHNWDKMQLKNDAGQNTGILELEKLWESKYWNFQLQLRNYAVRSCFRLPVPTFLMTFNS